MRVRRGGMNVGVNLSLRITGGCLVVSILKTQRGCKAVGRAVVPVRTSVHGGESKLTQQPGGFYPSPIFFFIFPSCNTGFEQNKPKFVGQPDSLPKFCKASHPF